MKISLTGASGFLGRFLIQRMQLAGHQVSAWCRCHPDAAPAIDGVRWIQGELGNADSARELVYSADAVIHCAVFRGGESFMHPTDPPVDYWQTNSTGSLQLLDVADACGVRQFLFVSSGAVHDQVLADRPLDETHPLLPSTLYGAYKASVETLIHHYGTSGKLWTASVRPTSIYGVDSPIEQSKWFRLVQDVKNGKDVHLTGGSKAVHASDVAKSAEILLSQDKSVSGQTFNCCDRMVSEFEVAEIAKRISGSDSKITGVRKAAKHEINTDKLQALGMQFGGTELLESTIMTLLEK